MIYLKILYPNTFDEFGLNLLHVYFLPSCLTWNFPEPKNVCPYLDQNDVSMMSQTSEAIWSCRILLPTSRTRTHQGSTAGLLLFQRFRVGLAVEYASWLIPELNLDLYVAVLIHWWVEVLHANRTTCMFMIHCRIMIGRSCWSVKPV